VVERIARRTLVACAVIAVMFGAWHRSIEPAVAVLAGGLLIGISFWAIRSSVDGIFRASRDGHQGANAEETGRKSAGFSLVKFFTRHAIVALAAYGMMVRLRLDPIGVLAGVSSLAVAVGVEAIRESRWRRFL
jgi:hypothetical protein